MRAIVMYPASRPRQLMAKISRVWERKDEIRDLEKGQERK